MLSGLCFDVGRDFLNVLGGGTKYQFMDSFRLNMHSSTTVWECGGGAYRSTLMQILLPEGVPVSIW